MTVAGAIPKPVCSTTVKHTFADPSSTFLNSDWTPVEVAQCKPQHSVTRSSNTIQRAHTISLHHWQCHYTQNNWYTTFGRCVFRRKSCRYSSKRTYMLVSLSGADLSSSVAAARMPLKVYVPIVNEPPAITAQHIETPAPQLNFDN
jgi:hypothetical protein